MEKEQKNVTEIFSRFQLKDRVTAAKPFGNGHINDTFLAITDEGKPKYILQRINHRIFKDVELLQNHRRDNSPSPQSQQLAPPPAVSFEPSVKIRLASTPSVCHKVRATINNNLQEIHTHKANLNILSHAHQSFGTHCNQTFQCHTT
jgi:hypothetical protein